MLVLASMSFAGTSIFTNTGTITGCGEFNQIWSITGTVTNATGGGNPLGGVTVNLLASDSLQVCQTVVTDLNGLYQFYPVYVPNNYYLRYTRNKFVAQQNFIYAFRYMGPVDVGLQELP
jgi:hypothetical protein